MPTAATGVYTDGSPLGVRHRVSANDTASLQSKFVERRCVRALVAVYGIILRHVSHSEFVEVDRGSDETTYKRSVSNRTVHTFTWNSAEHISSSEPVREDIDLWPNTTNLDVPEVQFGPITSIAYMSSSVCVVAMEKQLELQGPTISAISAEDTTMAEPLRINEQSASSLIDLSTLRITSQPSMSSLRILDHQEVCNNRTCCCSMLWRDSLIGNVLCTMQCS